MPTATPYEQLEYWLKAAWVSQGPAVCILDGISGVGKSRLASAFASAYAERTIFVRVAENLASVADLTFELLEEISSSQFKDPPSGSSDIAGILEHLLRQGAIVVLDNIEEILDQASGLPPSDIVNAVSRLARPPSLQGRLLLISNHIIPDGKWRDGVERRTLTPPGQDAAVSFLLDLLTATGRQQHIPSARMSDVVNWLGRIPRAIEVLVACLEVDALDDLIGLEPHAWELRDQAVSELLISRLEHRLLERTLARLDSSAVRMLEYLSVYRRPFDRAAILKLQDTFGSTDALREALASRFLLSPISSNQYSLNPVARSIARQRLARQQRVKLRGHSIAADYYSRHFRGSGLSGQRSTTQVRRGYDFVEARFHLIACGRDSDFQAIASQYRVELLRAYRKASAGPSSPSAVNELVLTLLAALDNDDRGYAGLRIFLARLLLTRGHPGDDVLALRQTRRAVRESTSSADWVLHLRVTAQVDGLGALRAAFAQGRGAVAAASVGPLYIETSKILSAAGQWTSAVEILKQGLDEPISLGYIFVLYQQSAAILSVHGRPREAIGVLQRGISVLGLSGPNVHRIAESALFNAHVHQDRASLLAITDQITVEEASSRTGEAGKTTGANLKALARALLDQVDRNYSRVAAESPSRTPALACQVSFCQLVIGNPALALATLDASTAPANAATEWLRGCIALCNRQGEAAEAAFERSLGRPLQKDEADDPNLWLRIWDRIPASGSVHPAFYFPVLPAALTGLPVDLHRKPEGRSIFESWSDAVRPQLAASASDSATEVGLTDTASSLSYEQPTIVNVVQVSPSIGSVSAMSSAKEHTVSDTYNVNQAGAVGRQASATGNTFQQIVGQGDSASMGELLNELKALRQEMRRQDGDAEFDVATGEVAQAEIAAAAGDTDAVQSHLSRAGKWALAAANSVGLTLAAAAIQAAAGM